ncbi:hypothetical protein [Nonomuraea antimicrobica]|uniref:hypothetical protein n=1 Tax=Nonomuraea antimicrobica TaxID=561173 RepID=UPI0031F024CE
MPDEVERGLAAYRAGDVPAARALLTTIAGAGRTAVSGHAAMALAGIELGEDGLDGSCQGWLKQVAAGEDPWLGPLAVEPLTYAREMCDGLLAGYAAHLEGHILIGQDETERAGKVLHYARGESHPAKGGSKGLHPWVAVRFGELLAGDTWLDLVYDQVENSAVSEGEVVREPFESALYQKAVSSPALVDVGLYLFPAKFGPVHAGLERLKTWSDERYERGRRLVLALHTHVEDSRDEERTRGLTDLREKLDLPLPR